MANCRFIFSILSIIILSSANGQILRDKEAHQLVKESQKIWINRHDSVLKFIEYQVSEKNKTSIDKHNLAEELKPGSGSTFTKIDKSIDHLGFEHVRQQQLYMGVPVEGAVYRTHGRNGFIAKANGVYHKISNIEIKPQIKEAEAYSKALKFTESKLQNWKSAIKKHSKGELVVLPVDNSYVLAYKFDIYSYQPLSRKFVYIDAKNGSVVKVEDRLRIEGASGTAITK
jgi:Zn-dependent metalloprotease